PRMLNSVSSTALAIPANLLGHEGGFSPDGKTYWATGGAGGDVVAIDVADARHPRVEFVGQIGMVNHGFSFSPDGRTMYLSSIQPHGLLVYDVSEIAARRPGAQAKLLGSLSWNDGTNGMSNIAVTWHGRAYDIFVDELGLGGVRFIDVSNPRRPKVISKLKLEVELPAHAAAASADTAGTGYFSYDPHYCAVDRINDPTALACAYFNSGIRVFDVRRPLRPREIAYYVPEGVGNAARSRLTGSEHANGDTGLIPQAAPPSLTADWCSSPPRFVGHDQLWVTCQDNGF